MERRIIRIIAIFFVATLGLSGLAYASSHDAEDPPAVEVEDGEHTDDGSDEDSEQTEEGDGPEGSDGPEESEDTEEPEGDDAPEGDEGGDADDSTEHDGDDTSDETDEDGEESGDEDDGQPGTAPVNGVERSTDGCPEGSFPNHGAYVSSTEERPRHAAAKSDCGKPAHAAGKGKGKGKSKNK